VKAPQDAPTASPIPTLRRSAPREGAADEGRMRVFP
jgi:hypothetical protein